MEFSISAVPSAPGLPPMPSSRLHANEGGQIRKSRPRIAVFAVRELPSHTLGLLPGHGGLCMHARILHGNKVSECGREGTLMMMCSTHHSIRPGGKSRERLHNQKHTREGERGEAEKGCPGGGWVNRFMHGKLRPFLISTHRE